MFSLCLKLKWPLAPSLHLLLVHPTEYPLITLMVTLANTGSVGYGCATTVDSDRHIEGFCCPHTCTTVTAHWVPDAFLGIYQLCHESLTGEFLFQSLVSHQYICYVFGVCFLFSGYYVATMFTYGGSTIGVCNTTILQGLPLAGICAFWW